MVAGNEILDAEGLTEELLRLFDNAALKRISATIAVGGNDVFIRRVSMPRMGYQEALQQLPKNQSIRIPVDVKNNKLDIHITDPRGDGASMQVLIVAAKKEAITLRQKVLIEAGATIHSVDIDAFALFNVFAHLHGEIAKERATLVDIGHESALIVVLDRGFPAVARRAYVGVSHLIEKLGDGNLMPDEAEQVLRSDNPPAIYPEAFHGWGEQLVEELTRSAGAVTRGDAHTGPIYLSGGGALIDGMGEFLRDRSGSHVAVFDPLTGIDAGKDLGLSHEQDGAMYALAIGLALRQVV